MGIILIGLISSCKKEGCGDSKATNYEENVKNKSGMCEYEATVKFYTSSVNKKINIELNFHDTKGAIDNGMVDYYVPRCGDKYGYNTVITTTEFNPKYEFEAVSEDSIPLRWYGVIVGSKELECLHIELSRNNTGNLGEISSHVKATSTSNNGTGKLSFWSSSEFTCSGIRVTLDGKTKSITKTKSSASCGDSGIANFTGLEVGKTYSYTASCSGSGGSWSGSMEVSEKCRMVNLTL